MNRAVSFRLNGKPVTVTTDDERMLLWVLRSDLGLTGTKFGCGEGLCGACTVVVDGKAVRSCATPLKDVAGKPVLTIEGIGGDHLHAIQQAFLDHHAFQCGYCTPGMIMTAYAFLPLRESTAPLATSRKIFSHPAFWRASSCKSGFWSAVETRA